MGFPQIAMLPSGVVPQLSQQLAAKRLTQAQQSELEMARRRAQKAAEGKRANATAARRAKRKALGQTPKVEVPSGPVQQTKDSDDEKDDLNQTDEDLEARLAITTNEKETKRLKRCACNPSLQCGKCVGLSLLRACMTRLLVAYVASRLQYSSLWADCRVLGNGASHVSCTCWACPQR
jgi:hypothetical protein